MEWQQNGIGDTTAQNKLGYYYEIGQGVTQSYENAAKWYQEAAKHNNIEAQYKLGSCFQHGLGVTQDYAKAVIWYLKAAQQGDMNAQCNLAYCYKNGKEIGRAHV